MASKYWDGHEYVREHARSKTESRCLVRLVEVIRTQWNEDYFMANPFSVRLNGEEYYSFATLDEAQDCFDHIAVIRHEIV